MDKLSKQERKQLMDMYDKTDDFFEKLKANPNLRFESKHRTNLKYYFDNDRNRFFEQLYLKIRFNMDIMNGKTNDIKINCFDECGVCGESVNYIFKDDVFTTDNEECFEIEPYSFEVAFPSGKVIFDDWPEYASDLLKGLDDDAVSINAFKGCVLRSQAYAQQNVMHVFVGNTCPSVYYKDGIILIGHNEYDYDKDIETPLMDNPEQTDSICTDLWWATGVDYEVYKKMAIKKFGKEDGTEKINDLFKKDFVTIKPGIYKVTHYFDSARYTTGDEPNVYTKLEWVRDIQLRRIK